MYRSNRIEYENVSELFTDLIARIYTIKLKGNLQNIVRDKFLTRFIEIFVKYKKENEKNYFDLINVNHFQTNTCVCM